MNSNEPEAVDSPEVGQVVPDIGDQFIHDERGYRVVAWLKRAEPRSWSNLVGPDRCALEFCVREEAEYVSGYGVAGVLVRVTDVRVSGRVSWTEQALDVARTRALSLAGHHAG